MIGRAAADDDAATAAPAAVCPVARSVWAAAAAGIVVGALDALASWSRLGQFLPGAGGRLATALHVGALYAAFAACAGAAAAALYVGFARFTALGDLGRHAAERHRAAREADPRRALVGLSLVIAGLPALGGALAAAYSIGFQTISRRHHKGLIVAVTIAATLAALAVGVLFAFALGRLVELGLRRLARGRLLHALSHPAAPAVAAAVLVVGGGAVGWALFRQRLSLDQLRLRPYAVTTLLVAATAAAWPLAGHAVRALRRLPRAARVAATPLVPLAALAVALAAGSSPAVRKGASAYTALGDPLATAVRRAIDLDRDGHSAVLGGGDCDDFDARINPHAVEIPDDGIDQNCGGGDTTLRRKPADVRFVKLPAGVPDRPNVLFVTIDTVRADHVGAYGYARPTTPALDAIAAEGSLFVNAWAHAPSTRYSIPAILTGRYPSQVLWDPNARGTIWWPGLKLENRTLAEVAKDAGYTTGAILNYHYFEKQRRMDQGFDTYDNTNARLHQGSDPASTSGTSSREQADAAIRWLDAHAGERFFLWVHFYDPHYRYEHHPGTEEFGGDEIAMYDHEIRFTDDQLARVVARLKELGVYDRTAIFVTGDHGEGFGEHRIDFHGYHLYAPQTKVPLVIRVPGVAPQRVTMPAGHVDLLPTLANLVGGAPDETMLGRSLLGEMSGQAPPDADRDVYQEVSYEGPTERRAVATRDFHLIYNRVPDNSWELYDLRADPGETRDLWGAAGSQELAGRLLTWIDVSQFPPGAGRLLAEAILAEPPSPRTPLAVDFGGVVRLLGVDLPEGTVAPGADFPVTWYFQSRGRVDGDWRVFVHFEGPGRFQGDHVPVEGVLPFSRWQKGQLIADRQTVTVPPGARPGEYTVWAGLWKPNQNMPAKGAPDRTDARNRVRVGTIRVSR